MLFRGPTTVTGETADLERKVSGQTSHSIAVKIIDRGGQVNRGVARGVLLKVQLQMENLMEQFPGDFVSLARRSLALPAPELPASTSIIVALMGFNYGLSLVTLSGNKSPQSDSLNVQTALPG
jgi:hypothetical protein